MMIDADLRLAALRTLLRMVNTPKAGAPALPSKFVPTLMLGGDAEDLAIACGISIDHVASLLTRLASPAPTESSSRPGRPAT